MPLEPIAANGKLKLTSERNSLAAAETQGDFREQIASLTDLCRQVFGDAVVVPGSGGPSDPLNAAFQLYVDPVRGVDTFAHGQYNTYDPPGQSIDDQIKNKLKRISNQQMVCGYSQARPFRTINRAAIECAIITSRDWFINDPKTHVDCIVIYLSAGVHVILNDPGGGGATAWPDNYTPTDADLIKFNPPEGGVILPRFASVQGADLRKTTLRPNYVPGNADEAADYKNRSAILRTTPSSLCFGMTFFDHWTTKQSHHLLSCFEFATVAQLDAFYAQVAVACGTGASLDTRRLVARKSEYNVVADTTAGPSEAWDVVTSASAYIYNCSIRSEYGLAGLFADGSKVGGLSSFVIAQFTGVSLQRDLSCWQVYKNNAWRQPLDYTELVLIDPDDVRMNPKRLSRHVSAINNAFIQEVSVFAIGQGIHHYADAGGELSITNSNSSFGGCAALARGYRSDPYPIDSSWQTTKVKVPTDLSNEVGNIKRINLGKIVAGTANDAVKFKLESPLKLSARDPATPEVLAKDNYSFKPGSYLWVENPTGPDFRARLPAVTWSGGVPDEITVSEPFLNEAGTAPGAQTSSGQVTITTAQLAGLQVYVRRMIDVRSPDERKYSLLITNTTNTRTPVRDFVLNTSRNAAGINRPLSQTEVLLVTQAIRRDDPTTGTNFDAEVTLRDGKPSKQWAGNTYYRSGDTVRFQNKHYTAAQDHLSVTAWNPLYWSESFVHMPSEYDAEDFRNNEGPLITFDNDTSGLEQAPSLGYDLKTVWTQDPLIKRQVESATDYRGMDRFLQALGFSLADRQTLLLPKPQADRMWDPAVGVVGIQPPNDAAQGWSNWAVQFHRPNVTRLYSHAWEWAGYLNYSKSLPPVQREMNPQNRFTYYFTNENGGRVFATGNNEDGFEVSPYGLTNISTGSQLSVENIGGSDLSLDVTSSTNFNSITVNELTVNNKIILNGFIDALPRASVGTQGTVDLATAKETTDAFLTNTFPQAKAGSALSLGAIAGLRDAVLRAVKLLEVRFARLYVDGRVVRSSESVDTPATAASIPNVVWQDFKANAWFHKVESWDGARPPAGSAAEAMGCLLCFNTLNQATEFINNRDTEDRSDLTISIYATSTCTAGIEYRGSCRLSIVKGANQPAQTGNVKKTGMAPTLFMNGISIGLGRNAKLTLWNLDINGSGTVANPDQIGQPFIVWGVDGQCECPVDIKNCYIKVWSSWPWWFYVFFNIGVLNLHSAPSDIAPADVNDQFLSRVTFDIKRVKTTPDDFGGLTSIVTGGKSLVLNTSRPNFVKLGQPSIPTDCELNFIVDQGTDIGQGIFSSPFFLFSLLDGGFMLAAQTDQFQNSLVGCTYNFDIRMGQKGHFAFCRHGGVSTQTSAMSCQWIHEYFYDYTKTPPTPGVPGDPNVDHAFKIKRLTSMTQASTGAPWVEGTAGIYLVILFDIGFGVWADYKLGFHDRAHFMNRFGDAISKYFTDLGFTGTDNRFSNPSGSDAWAAWFARLQVNTSGRLNTRVPPNYIWFSLKDVRASDGRLIELRNNTVGDGSARLDAPRAANAPGEDLMGAPPQYLLKPDGTKELVFPDLAPRPPF